MADAALILTAHRAMDVERVLAAAPLVVDATRATAGRQAPNLVRLGTPLA